MKTTILVGSILVTIVVAVAVITSVMVFTPKPNNDITATNSFDTPYYLKELSTIEKPADFKLIMRELQSGYIDVCDLDERYYLQPDFYEDSWAVGKRYYEDHDYGRWVVHGHGAYPGNPSLRFDTPMAGDWIQFCTFYRTGWGTETYQGIKLVPDYNEYFDVAIEPNELLLAPTYPVIQKDWVRKLNITVAVTQIPPKGTYTIPINSVQPSAEQSREWFWEVLKKDITPEQYKMLEECKYQQEKTGDMNMECEEWIQTARRNKYVEAGNIQVGARLVITVDVI